MNQDDYIYFAIDLKSFYASVECIDRGLDPLTTNLVVADAEKTEKTICLAVTPSLKKYGLSGRARLFEVIQTIKQVNIVRRKKAHNYQFSGESYNDEDLKENPDLSITYIVAPPRMEYYLEYSTKIHEIYLKYISPDDLHVYSIDEVFINVTNYFKVYNLTPIELAKTIINDIFVSTGITATVGIGTNLYLCKVAMDIVAKHIKPDKDGTRIAQLDEMKYRKLLWKHRPITDFWRVGKGYAQKLEKVGLYTMGDIAKCSIGGINDYYNEDLLYDLFGINAELLIDHAWGKETCTMIDIKNYKSLNNSISMGQVLSTPYSFDKAKLIVKEMLDLLALDLVDKKLVLDQIVITIGYDIENVNISNGKVIIDSYGRKVPKPARGTVNLDMKTSSSKLIINAGVDLYEKIVNKQFTIRKINISANHVIKKNWMKEDLFKEQMNLFVDYDILEKQRLKEKEELKKEAKLQEATLEIKRKYGKNALLKGMNLEEGANTIKRNETIGGHKA